MKATIQDKILTIALPYECLISNVEADTDKIRPLISRELKKIEVQSEAVEEADTAYLQLLLSLKATADHQKVLLSVSGISPELERVCGLYGVMLDV